MYAVPDQAGRLVVVTGANSGTGKEATQRLAGAGAHVVMAVRTVAKGEQARREILTAHPGARLEVRRIDLADLASVAEFADGLIADGTPVDVLNAAHPGFTRTNLQTAGASLGRDKPKRTPFNSFSILPSQKVGPGTEPLLYAAADAAAANSGYYGPGRWFGLVGPTTTVRPPRRARDTATATRLWAEAERLTGTALPAGAAHS